MNRHELDSTQLSFNLEFSKSTAVMDALMALADCSSREERGAIFTRVEIVEFILDLVGYSSKQPLHCQRILEPSFGSGDFLFPIIERLMSSWRNAKNNNSIVSDQLEDAIRAVELHNETFESTRQRVIQKLISEGFSKPRAIKLSDIWLIRGDFLLENSGGKFNYVVGNPPYVRQELIPAALIKEYRLRYNSVYDRADLYIPFIERSLSLLGNNGVLGFICADRWMKNKYGGPLRRYISENFHLKAYINMVDTAAFHTEVDAYPAITIISRERTNSTKIVHQPKIDRNTLRSFSHDILACKASKNSSIHELKGVVNGSEPWLLETVDQMKLIRRLERDYPLLEEVGCKVGIGVATGADKVFIGNYELLDVERDRKLPLVTTSDISTGEIQWQGQGVINPFDENGKLVDLDRYPRLSRYLKANKNLIARRHCAQKTPSNWYRTIDRIWPALAKQPKLLIPDIKGEAHVVYENGALYPHHNLYYVTSNVWDLRALQALLLSRVAKLFISTYSTKMRGGYLRFQAQYLRRIRVPRWENISADDKKRMIEAAQRRDLDECNRIIFDIFNLNKEERTSLGGNGDRNGH